MRGKLTFDRLRVGSGYPKIKAKAAATRRMSRYGLDLARPLKDGSTHAKMRLGVCQQLVRFYELLESEAMFTSEEAKAEVIVVCSRLLTMYHALSREALAPPVQKYWKMVPKFHLFQHLCEIQFQIQGNP